MDDFVVDYMDTHESAAYLAAVIRQYWSTRGLYPKVVVEKMTNKSTQVGTLYVVRSDMVGGKPRG